MFLTTLSPLGGKRLSSLWAGIKGEKNLIFHPENRPQEVGDYLCYRIGYADRDIKKGELIYIKKSDGKYVKKLFEMYF